MDLFQAIKERRSIRKYKATPVSEEQLNTIFDAVRWAPSWANTQCWRFVVVRDRETKERLADTLSLGNPSTAAIKSAPIVIVACAQLGRSGHYKGTPVTDKGDWFMFDLGLAMQNLTLAAHGLGLGTVNVGYFDAAKVAQILALPEGIAVVEMTPLGYPEDQPVAPKRKELSEFVFYEKYGQGKP
jgi:nitroreductase